MCLNSRTIMPKYREVNLAGYRFRVNCKCGKCVECEQEKAQDFVTRFHYDATYTIQKGGYVYVDTLTYNDRHLPKHFGIAHFCNADVKRFKSNLEKKTIEFILKYKGLSRATKNYNEAKALYRADCKVLLIEEYGGDYHRPHLHLVIFNRIPEVNSIMLERCVMESWIDSKGKRLGGIEARPAVEKELKSSIGTGVYLSNYLSKRDDYYEVIGQKRKHLVEKFGKDSLTVKKFDKLYATEFKPRNIFYQGFGSKLESFYKAEDLLVSNKITIPDSIKVLKEVRIPEYTVRRVFKERIKREDGTYAERWTETGIEYIQAWEKQKFDGVVRFYRRLIDNYDSYASFIRKDDDLSYEDVEKSVKERVESLLAGRPLEKFVEYILYYKDRFSHQLGNIREINGVKRRYVYPDKDLGARVISLLQNPDCRLDFDYRELSYMAINDTHNEAWHDFDRLSILFDMCCRAFNEARNEYSKEQARSRNRNRKSYKAMFHKCGIK